MFKKRPKLTLVKKPKPKLTFELIANEAKTALEKIYLNESGNYSLSPAIFGVPTYQFTGRILSVILIHKETGELKQHALKHLIPDFDERFEV